MNLVIYLHGFGSVGKTDKSESLRKMVMQRGDSFFAPDLPFDPIEAKKIVTDQISKSWSNYDQIVLVGTSLGGFLAHVIGEEFDIPYVVVNPAINPSEKFGLLLEDIKSGAVEPPRNYKTKAMIDVNEQAVAEFSKLEKAWDKATARLVHLFIAEDDDVLDPVEAQTFYKFSAVRMIYRDGGHRFESHWREVVDYVSDILISRRV